MGKMIFNEVTGAWETEPEKKKGVTGADYHSDKVSLGYIENSEGFAICKALGFTPEGDNEKSRHIAMAKQVTLFAKVAIKHELATLAKKNPPKSGK